MDQLQRDGRLQDEIVGAPDVAHAAAADARDHPVAAREHFARRERRAATLGRGLDLVVLLVKSQQRFRLLPQRRIVAAGVRQKRRAVGGRPLEGREKHVFRALV